jgi:chromate transporter
VAAASGAKRVAYTELARLFIRLSLSAFGGPVAHIAIAEDEIVARRGWLTRDHYLDLVAATNLIPGPNSTEVMIHVGYVLRGIPGAVFTGICFILPAALLSLALAALYVSSGALPQTEALLWGIKPVIIAIIAQVGWRLMRTALKTRLLWALAGAAAALLLLGDVPEVLVMLAAGGIYALAQTGRGLPAVVGLAGLAAPIMQTAQAVESAARAGLWDLFWYFLRIGSVLFGSGYILIVYIQQDLVNTLGWLSARELLDAIAVGQATPGPVLTTVTVVGYLVAGLPGALVGTLGIFLPSFVLVILTAPLIPRMRSSAFWGAFLAGVNAGVIAAIGVTLLDLGQAALQTRDGAAFSPLAAALALGALALLLRFRLNATWVIALGGLAGLAAAALGI